MKWSRQRRRADQRKGRSDIAASRDSLLWLMLALPFLGNLAAAVLPSYARNAAGLLAGTVALIGTALVVFFYFAVADGTVVRTEIEWRPSLGLNLLIRLDGLTWI